MIGEIGVRYRLFLNTTTNIKTVPLVQAVREEFQNYYGTAYAYLEERALFHKSIHNGKSYFKQEINCKYFLLEGYKAACINFTQVNNTPKNRGFFVELIQWDDKKDCNDMVPFIKFKCNPAGMYLLEKIMFRSL